MYIVVYNYYVVFDLFSLRTKGMLLIFSTIVLMNLNKYDFIKVKYKNNILLNFMLLQSIKYFI